MMARLNKDAFPATVQAASAELARLLSAFSTTVSEATLIVHPLAGSTGTPTVGSGATPVPVEIKSYHDRDKAKPDGPGDLRTDVTIDPRRLFSAYTHTSPHAIDATFHLRDFRVMVSLAEALRGEVLVRIMGAGSPLVVEPFFAHAGLSEADVEAELVLSTIPESQLESGGGSGGVGGRGVSGGGEKVLTTSTSTKPTTTTTTPIETPPPAAAPAAAAITTNIKTTTTTNQQKSTAHPDTPLPPRTEEDHKGRWMSSQPPPGGGWGVGVGEGEVGVGVGVGGAETQPRYLSQMIVSRMLGSDGEEDGEERPLASPLPPLLASDNEDDTEDEDDPYRV